MVIESFTLLTERLMLRGWQDADAGVLEVIWSDPQVYRYLPFDEPRSHEQCLDSIQRMRDHWMRHGYGVWAVLERRSGRLVGYGGLRRLEDSRTELLYGLAADTWGRGYASELGRAAVGFAFDTVKLERLVAFVDPDNRASRHVLEKLGFTLEGEGFEFGMKVVLYRLESDKPRL